MRRRPRAGAAERRRMRSPPAARAPARAGRPAPGSSRELLRPLPEGDLDRLLGAAAPHLDVDVVARLAVLDRLRDVLGILHLVAVDLGDDVAGLGTGVGGRTPRRPP